MAKRITDEEQKKLLQLFENSKSGNDDEVDAFDNYLEELGINPNEVQEYLAVKNGPETEQEKRLANKGKAADEKRSADAIPAEKIAEAYGVDLKKAEKDGELSRGGLQKYLMSRAVMTRLPGESGKDYVDRNRNAFEQLGLNWDNKEDRALVAKSMELAETQDARQAIADDMNGGLKGFLMNVVFPRTMEHATRDVMNGEETEGYGTDTMLDATENGLQFAATPFTGPAGALAKYMKVGKVAIDGGKKANKAVKAAGALAGIGADAATVPFVMESLDAINYDDPTNSRSEFNGNDVIQGALVNAYTPTRLKREFQRGKRGAFGEEMGKAEQAFNDLDDATNLSGLKKYFSPYVTNKLGKDETVKMIPSVGNDIYEEVAATKKKNDSKNKAAREKREKWSRGFAIPFPGDRDYEEYTKWKQENTRKVLGLGKYL